MSIKRFEYQRKAAIEALQKRGTVLNIGCNTDPAGLKALNPYKILNIDRLNYDPILDKPINADIIFDITREWPIFVSCLNYELAILGDILEHIEENRWLFVLCALHEIVNKLCITVPQDNRLFENKESGLYHITYVTRDFLQKKLEETHWKITDWVELDNIEDGNVMWWEKYYFLTAERV